MRSQLLRILIATIIVCFSVSVKESFAQKDTTVVKKWHFLVEPYLLFPYMTGETGIGGVLTVPVDATPKDIVSNLKMTVMLYAEANTDKWSFNTDLIYANLLTDVAPSDLLNSGTVGVKQTIWELAGLYRILPFWEMGLGGRLNYLQTNINVRRNVFPGGTEEASGQHDATWLDPIVITRVTADIDDKWLFQFRGDVGGFGLGSDLTWQLQTYAGYRFTKFFQLSAGYRIISIDYDEQVTFNQFVFNVNESGPVVKFGFNF